VTPARIGMQGGLVVLHGMGFNQGLQVSAGAASGDVLTVGANDIQASLPAGALDGVTSIKVNDLASGGFSLMTDSVTYGAAATDGLLLLQGTEPSTPVGGAATNPIRVRVVAADRTTPINGATIAWSATNGASLSACGGAAACSALSDESGVVVTQVTPTAIGTSIVTAALAPASYPSPQSKEATVLGTESALDLAAITATRWVGQGATIDIPLIVRALNMGAPISNLTINFRVSKGVATLASATGMTDSQGYASTSVHLANHTSDVQVTACAAPNNAPCQTFTMFATPASNWKIENVNGSAQTIVVGQTFQPLLLRITDGGTPSDPVMGVTLVFGVTVERVSKNQGGGGGDDGGGGGRGGGTPVILGTYEARVSTGDGGIANWVPTVDGAQGYCDLLIALTAGPATSQFHLQVVEPIGTPAKLNGDLKPRPEAAEERMRGTRTNR
jgi:hypothetical protein